MAPMKSPSHQEMPEELEVSVTLTHLAHRWNISRREVRRLLQIGKLPFVQVADQIRVPLDAVRAIEEAGSLGE
ncbi:MAG: helix-turn-helix domain-containing protein [Planctomycetales bacterium]|nr:helix-turn-helix domain-containing protein [Planctomycetales bacterium]